MGIGISSHAARLHIIGDNYSKPILCEVTHIYGLHDGIQIKTKRSLNCNSLYYASLFKASFDSVSSGYAYITLQKGSVVQYVNSSGKSFFAGSMGIGCNHHTDALLAVNGTIKAKKVNVTLSGFPDYVFKPGYSLLSLSQTEAFIKENGHLPGVPTEKEVMEQGIDLGQLNVIMLEKIEEMTLHIIELEKEIKQLKQHNKTGKK